MKKRIPQLLDASGALVELEAGHVLETKIAGNLSPLLVIQMEESFVGNPERPDTLLQFRLATRDHVMLKSCYTAYQLDHAGYRIQRSSSMGEVNKVLKLQQYATDPRPLAYDKPDGRASPVTRQQSLILASPPPASDAPASEEAAPAVEPAVALSEKSTADLLDELVWGIQPDNLAELEKELAGRGLDTGLLCNKISELLAGVAKSVDARRAAAADGPPPAPTPAQPAAPPPPSPCPTPAKGAKTAPAAPEAAGSGRKAPAPTPAKGQGVQKCTAAPAAGATRKAPPTPTAKAGRKAGAR